jgi:hypothetical protein
MKLSIPGIILIILGFLLIVGPWTFAPVCEIGGMYVKTAAGTNLPMPCGWTARAEIGVGALTILAGVLLTFSHPVPALHNKNVCPGRSSLQPGNKTRSGHYWYCGYCSLMLGHL